MALTESALIQTLEEGSMTSRRHVFALCAFYLTSAGTPTLEIYKSGKATFSYPKQWQATEDLYGVPLMVLSKPDTGGFRSVLSMTPEPISVPNNVSVANDFIEEKSNFMRLKSEWAKKSGAKILGQEEYKTFTTPHQITVHQYGVEYELSGIKYKDYTLLLVKNLKCYYLKILVKSDHSADYAQQIQIVNTLRFL